MKEFYLFMVQLEYKDYDVTSVWIQCNNCNKHVYCQILETVLKEIILVLSVKIAPYLSHSVNAN